MERTPEVSVVVPTYGRSDQLQRLLDSIERVHYDRPFEVIIVDDASPDDTPEIVARWQDTASAFAKRYIRVTTNSGPAHARNEGTREARGEFVVYTDSDCTVDPEWLLNLTNPEHFQGDVVGVGGRVLPAVPRGLVSKYNTYHRILEPPGSLLYLVTCNCCYRRGPLLDAGGFDERVDKPGGEDIGLSIKLYHQGYRFGYAASAIVYHSYRESLTNFWRTWGTYGEGTGYATTRYLPDDSTDVTKIGPDSGWGGNPLNPVHFGGLKRELRRAYRVARADGVPPWDNLRFLVLRYMQVKAFREGWARGVVKALEAKGQLPASHND